MDSTTWKRAKQIFHEALEKSAPDRDGFVAAACADDDRLRTQVQALLKAQDEAGEFLASPTVAGADEAARVATTLSSSPPAERPGTTIGPYKLLQVIGEGGFGVVYMAEQEEPVRRRVALKIIKLGMDTKQVIARFEAERQALALMEHPSIARVLDAGATETGRPYFVMELVKGVPITEYCDSNRLSTRERLDLFRETCAAVQHAHQKGIIHRDLKPSNVLVTLHDGKPVPKVIDFGISKATNQRLTEKTLFTEYGQFIGTPAYMSPEQAEMSGLDVDTRSDIYSLGVLLYELLTGTTPFDAEALRQAGYVEIQRIIREVDPPKPSTRLSTLGGALTDTARQRKIDPRGLSRLLRGELDWIVMKALEKARGRRYDSPGEFAGDIARHMAHEPVTAGPPGVAYRARKFLRRHRIGVTVAGAIALALIAGIAVATYGLVEARRANVRAQREAATATEVSEFLVGLFEVSDPGRARGNTITAREILDQGAQKIDRELDEQPEIQADLLETMGRVYRSLGLYEEADSLFGRSYRIRKRVHGDEHEATLSAKYSLASAFLRQGKVELAERMYLELLEARRRVSGESHESIVHILLGLGSLRRDQGRADEAERYFTEALEMSRRVLGDDDLVTRRCLKQLGDLHISRGHFSKAEAIFLEVYESRRARLGPDHPDTIFIEGRLADLYKAQGRFEDAEGLYGEAVELARRVLGEDHPDTLASMRGLAGLYERTRRFEEAESLYRRVLERERRTLGDDDRSTLRTMNALGRLYNELGRNNEAERLYLEALEGARGHLGGEHLLTLSLMNDLGWLYNQLGRADEAEKLHVEALETRRRVLGENHEATLWSKSRLAGLYGNQKRYDEAERLYRETLDGRRRTLGDDHPDTIVSMNNLAWLLLTREPAGSRDPQAALSLALEANELGEYRDYTHLDTLALAYHLTGNAAKAIETQKKAISLVPSANTELRDTLGRRLEEFERATERTPR